MSIDRIVIVGGGWAGLAAASKLSNLDFEVQLFEKAKTLGGRCASYYDENFDEWLDHGSHVFIGAYRQSLALLEEWDVRSGVDFSKSDYISWLYPNGKVVKLNLDSGSSKASAVASFMKFKGMTMGERLKTIRVADAIARLKLDDVSPDMTVSEFLEKFGIKPRSCGGLWDALTVAVMNAPSTQVSILPMLTAIKEGLLFGGEAARIGLPTRPLKHLYIDAAHEYLTDRNIEVKCDVNVKSLQIDRKGVVKSIRTEDDEIEADFFIITIPPMELLRLLPRKLQQEPFFSRFSNFVYSSISGIHINFERPVLDHAFAFMPGASVHWIFGRGTRGPDGWQRISAVMSNSPTKREMSNEEIADAAVSDIRERLIETRRTGIEAIRVVRTARATVVLRPGTEKLRPSNTTPFKNLFLAGDWCDTGLPATIESAARSGSTVAELILKSV